jgi:hypothetical protein
MFAIEDKNGRLVKMVQTAKQAKDFISRERVDPAEPGQGDLRLTARSIDTGLTVAGPGLVGAQKTGRTQKLKDVKGRSKKDRALLTAKRKEAQRDLVDTKRLDFRANASKKKDDKKGGK